MRSQSSFLLQCMTFASSVIATANPGGWNTVFLDDFTGAAGSLPDSSKWILQTGTSYPGGPAQWGTGEVETYTQNTQNVHQDGNGNLLIIPQKSSSGTWTSARLETVQSNFQAPAGQMMRIESRIQLPNNTASNGIGYWPAFWALGGNLRQNYTAWPSVGEFDILENVNAGNNVFHGLHCGVNPGGPCNEPNGLVNQDSCPSGNCRDGNFHIYTMIHDRRTQPESLHFYIDFNLQRTITQTQVGNATWAQSVQHGFYLVANVAMGGSFPNALYGSTTPTASTVGGKALTVDYIGVFQAS